MKTPWNLSYLAPALLLCIASIQFFYCVRYDMSPWKGGGFGMFSTIDSPGSRIIRVYANVNNQYVPISEPSRYKSILQRVKTLPTSSNISILLDSLKNNQWTYYQLSPPGLNEITTDVDSTDYSVMDINKWFVQKKWFREVKKDEKNVETIPIDHYKIEVWKLRYSSKENKIHLEPLLNINSNIH